METILARDMVQEYTASYAQYVATSRSVPALSDGLKPVQRRCINAANDLKLYHNKKHMKVSKLAGDVLGNYHPHGGANPVLMAQSFRYRYPLFDGQGNYGSPDMPDSYAAARYLEIRLSKFCEDFYLTSAEYADRESNYDGRLKEITQYYPALPGCLFTGASGIAVGFSTEVPTHTITDIGNSMIAYMKNPKSEKYLEGLYPETCEKSVILSTAEDIKKLYKTGVGSLRYKASTHYETINGRSALVVEAFPPGFSKKKLEAPAVLEAVDKGLLEVSNESSENLRYVFTSSDSSVLEDLESRLVSSVGYRMYIDHRGVIKLYSIKGIYEDFIEDRSAYIVRKYSGIAETLKKESEYLRVLFLLKQDKEYLKSMFDKSSEEVIEDIVRKYETNESVAKRIISTTLRTLMSDNAEILRKKREDLEKEIVECEKNVSDPKAVIMSDIKSLLAAYKGEQKNAVLLSEHKDEFPLVYQENTLRVQKSSPYFLCSKDNQVQILYGEELKSLDLNEYFLIPANKEYYFFYDGKGCCSVTKDTLLKSGSKFLSEEVKGVIGMDSLEDIDIEQGNGRVYKGVKWSLRQKASRIKLSKEDEPDFKILKQPPQF